MYSSEFPHGLMFHYFHDEKNPPSGQGSISAREFEAILHFVGIDNILSPEEWMHKLKINKLHQNNLCITLDEGIKCQYDVCLPILEKYNLKSFWFIYSSVFEGKFGKLEIYNFFRSRYFDNVDAFYELFFKTYEDEKLIAINEYELENYIQEKLRSFPFYSFNDLKFRFIRDEILQKNEYEELMDRIIKEKSVNINDIAVNIWLTNAHIRSLNQKGHFIGLHSYDHPTALSNLSYNEQLYQYEKNYLHIEKVCGKKAISMSHPSNSYNNNTLEILRHLNILCGFVSNMYPSRGELNNPSHLEIAREDCANILKKLTVNNKVS